MSIAVPSVTSPATAAASASATATPASPTLHQPAGLLLTDYTQLKGCSCKIPQAKLLALLKAGGFDDDDSAGDRAKKEAALASLPQDIVACARPGTGDDVGMDCSIEELKYRDLETKEKLFLISTTDFFFPSVENAHDQGCVGAANVISDLCAMGIDQPDNVLMLLAASTEMDEAERTGVTIDIIRGFNSTVRAAGSRVTGGQSVYNPWPLIGGVAMVTLPESKFIRPTILEVGDVLVLTKPLGTQLGVNLKHWSKRPTRLFENGIEGKMSQAEIDELYTLTVKFMSRLNTNGAKLMMKYKSHGATDVTGFGLLGHAKNWGASQDPARCKLVIDTLPIIKGAQKADELLGNRYHLLKGVSAETSGGLLMALDTKDTAQRVVDELAALGETAWIVGRVELREDPTTEPPAVIAADHKIIEVDAM